MSIRRITISVPEKTARAIKKAAGQRPVSAWLTELVEDHLSDAELDRQFEEFYKRVAPTKADVARADAMIRRMKSKPRRQRAA